MLETHAAPSAPTVQAAFLEWTKKLSLDSRGSVTQRAVRVSQADVLDCFTAAFPEYRDASTLGVLRCFVALNPELESGFFFDREKWRCLQVHQRL